MTVKELSQLYYLNREIEMDKRRLEELEAKLQPGGQSLSGMPRGNGAADKLGIYVAEIADLRDIIEEKHRRCLLERRRLERFIAGINDSLVRQVFTYRFVDGLPWEQVAEHIGGGNTAGGVKKICYRFIKNF